MKQLTDYLERAAQLEALAADGSDSRLKDQLLAQAQSYRKLAAKRAQEYGLPMPSPPAPSSETTT